MELNENELKVLSEYKFQADDFVSESEQKKVEKEILCLRRQSHNKNEWRLEKIVRAQIRWWQMVLAFFGWGDLRYSTQDIGKYLNTRKLSKITEDSPAFTTIHHVASRVLAKRDSVYQPLWHQISTKSAVFTISDISRHKGAYKQTKCVFDEKGHVKYAWTTYKHYESQNEQGSRELRLYWNSLAKIDHLKMQISAITKTPLDDIESTFNQNYYEERWDAYTFRRAVCGSDCTIESMLNHSIGFNRVVERTYNYPRDNL